MNVVRSIMSCAAVCWIVLCAGCFSVPHLFWPQKDIPSQEWSAPSAKHSILIAGRQSEFKESVIEKIKSSFTGDSVSIKCIGLTQLEHEKTDTYDAVVLLNTCMSWDMDRRVNKFLKTTDQPEKVIVLTTSASGIWQPKTKGREFDAISSASAKNAVDTAAGAIQSKIVRRLR